MKRYVTGIDVMGRGRYRITVKSKRWWQRRWTTTVYQTGLATIVRWEDASQPGVQLDTRLSWFLTDYAIQYMSKAWRASNAAR